MKGGALTGKGLTGKAVKALSVFGGTQVVGILCSIIRTKLIAIWIGPIGVGLFAIYNSVIDMVGGVTQLSMRQTAVRDVAQASSASAIGRIATVIRWWGLRLGFLGAVVMLAASPLLSMASFGDASRWWAFALLSVCLFLLSLSGSEQALMQGTGHLTNLAKCLVYSAIIGTALSLPLLYLFGSQGIIPSIIVFSLVGLVCSAIFNDVEGVKQASAESRAMGIGFLRLGVALTISTFAATGMSYAFLSFLTQTAGEETAGVYQSGYTLTVKYVELVFTALAMDYYPRLAAVCHNRRLTSVFVSHQASLLMCVMAPMLIVFLSADQLFVRLLYTDKFMGALPMMTFAIGGVVFRALSYCYSYLIVSKGEGKVYIFTELTSCAIGLSLNIAGYKLMGLAGVGISYALWYLIYAIMCREVCRRRYGVDISLRAQAIALIAIAIACVSIWLRMYGWWLPLLMAPAAAGLVFYAWRRKRLA